MRTVALAIVLISGWLAAASAGEADWTTERKSLCNAKMQVKDNLSIRMGVRDGQLRLGESEGSFRIYLVNTMNRALFDLKLVATGPEFDAKIEPSPDWKEYPTLETAVRGGREQYFTVTLKRKPGVADGKYKVGLHLWSSHAGYKEPWKFVELDLAAAQEVLTVPADAKVQLDGKVEEEEWKVGLLCTDLHCFAATGKKHPAWVLPFYQNLPAKESSRFRLSADGEKLYCLMQLPGGDGAKADSASLHLASGPEAKPLTVTVNRLTGEVTSSEPVAGLVIKADAERRAFEIAVPRSALGAKDAVTFRANFSRALTDAEGKDQSSFWRGNAMSLKIPASFPEFRVGGEKAP
ncbi:MAG TPA: hypothetical protein PK280_08995 [Planctomycetota bacterium]|nr:hypothetical protein [Planctomycetota bacterium]